VPSGVQTTPILGNLDCVSSCKCDTAEREHAVEAYSGPPFVHSEDFQQIRTVSSLSQRHSQATVICEHVVMFLDQETFW